MRHLRRYAHQQTYWTKNAEHVGGLDSAKIHDHELIVMIENLHWFAGLNGRLIGQFFQLVLGRRARDCAPTQK